MSNLKHNLKYLKSELKKTSRCVKNIKFFKHFKSFFSLDLYIFTSDTGDSSSFVRNYRLPSGESVCIMLLSNDYPIGESADIGDMLQVLIHELLHVASNNSYDVFMSDDFEESYCETASHMLSAFMIKDSACGKSMIEQILDFWKSKQRKLCE